MSWLRIDDGEVLDDRVGDLTDREYRARHALLQYVAREAAETGIVHEKRVNRAAYSTPNGVRTLTTSTLRKLIDLGLVERVEDLTNEYLEALGIERPEGPGWLRPSRWERFNPPRDSTNAERQRRYRQALRNGVTNDVTDRRHNASSRVGAPAFPSRPLEEPSQSVNPLLDQSDERPTDGHSPNGRSAEEQARIDEIDKWWEQPPETPASVERDPFSEQSIEMSPLGEQLAAAKAREEQA